MHRPPYILSASTNLLGICFIILTGLKLANANARSHADEIAWLAALLLFVAVLNAYLAIRNEGARNWQVRVADAAFLGGVTALAVAVIIAAIYL
jgi:cellobiose-specific phosphotransferase system component IIC